MDESLVMTFDHFPTHGIVHFSILLFPHFSCQMPNFFELSVDENELKEGIRTGWELLAGLPADESEYFKRTSGAITSVPLAMVHRERMQCAPPKESLRHLLNGRQVPRDVLRHDTHPVAAQSPAQTAALTSPPPFLMTSVIWALYRAFMGSVPGCADLNLDWSEYCYFQNCLVLGTRALYGAVFWELLDTPAAHALYLRCTHGLDLATGELTTQRFGFVNALKHSNSDGSLLYPASDISGSKKHLQHKEQSGDLVTRAWGRQTRIAV